MELWPHIHCEPLNETDPETHSTSGSVPESQLVSDFYYSRTSVFLPDLLLNDSYSSLPTLDQQEPQVTTPLAPCDWRANYLLTLDKLLNVYILVLCSNMGPEQMDDCHGLRPAHKGLTYVSSC